MSITLEDLPQLISTAVKKAVADGQIDQKSLDAMLHKPITLGLLPAVEERKSTTAVDAASLPAFPIRLGYHMNSLQQLATLKDVEGPKR